MNKTTYNWMHCLLTSIISYPVDVDGLLPLVLLKHRLHLIAVSFSGDVVNCNSKRRTTEVWEQ